MSPIQPSPPRKKLPIGIQTFAKIREDDYYYPGYFVRRAKALFLSGCESRPVTFSLQPVAIGAIVEVTKRLKPSVQRVLLGLGEHAGRNVSEHRAGLEMGNAQADPPRLRGRPTPQVQMSEFSLRLRRGIGGGMCERGKQTQHGKPHCVVVRATNQMPARVRLGAVGWRRGS